MPGDGLENRAHVGEAARVRLLLPQGHVMKPAWLTWRNAGLALGWLLIAVGCVLVGGLGW